VPPHVIAIVSQKGGSGKTTLALNLGAAHDEAGRRAVIADLDPQASATAWSRSRVGKQTLLVIPTHPAALSDLLVTATLQKVDWLLLDTAAGTDESASAAVEAASLVLVPCRPSLMDLRAISTTVRLCRLRGAVPHVILTQVEPVGTLAGEARASLAKLGIDVVRAELGRRVAFHHCLTAGRGVMGYEPHGKAADEVREVYRAVLAMLALSHLT
jgi:chromosome partitioning protein